MYDIKNISIKQFLSEQGIFPKQERTNYGMYLSPFRTETVPSFKVDYNREQADTTDTTITNPYKSDYLDELFREATQK